MPQLQEKHVFAGDLTNTADSFEFCSPDIHVTAVWENDMKRWRLIGLGGVVVYLYAEHWSVFGKAVGNEEKVQGS
jgi:hypothetical protein